MSMPNRVSESQSWPSLDTGDDDLPLLDSSRADLPMAAERFAQLMGNATAREDDFDWRSDGGATGQKGPATESQDCDERRHAGKDDDALRDEANLPGRSLAESILQSLRPAETGPAPATENHSDIQLACQKLVDHILLSAPNVKGDQQVLHLTIKDSILPTTEIRLSRIGGELSIAIETGSPTAFRLLDQHKTALQDRLIERLRDSRIAINVTYNQRGNDQDGRSRQRRNLYEEIHDDGTVGS